MNIYTSSFDKVKYIEFERPDIVFISISLFPPDWFLEKYKCEYRVLAPLYSHYNKWKTLFQNNLKDERAVNHFNLDFYNIVLKDQSARKVVRRLQKISNDKDICLLGNEQDPKYCHRSVISKWLNDNNYSCIEYSKIRQETIDIVDKQEIKNEIVKTIKEVKKENNNIVSIVVKTKKQPIVFSTPIQLNTCAQKIKIENNQLHDIKIEKKPISHTIIEPIVIKKLMSNNIVADNKDFTCIDEKLISNFKQKIDEINSKFNQKFNEIKNCIDQKIDEINCVQETFIKNVNQNIDEINDDNDVNFSTLKYQISQIKTTLISFPEKFNETINSISCDVNDLKTSTTNIIQKHDTFEDNIQQQLDILNQKIQKNSSSITNIQNKLNDQYVQLIVKLNDISNKLSSI